MPSLGLAAGGAALSLVTGQPLREVLRGGVDSFMLKVGSLCVRICLQKGWGQRGAQHDAAGTSFPSYIGSTPLHCLGLEGTAAVERRFPLGSEFQFLVASEGNSLGEAEETSGGGQERDRGGVSDAGVRPEGQHCQALLWLPVPTLPRPA